MKKPCSRKRYPDLPRSVPLSWTKPAPGRPELRAAVEALLAAHEKSATCWTSHRLNSARPWILRRVEARGTGDGGRTRRSPERPLAVTTDYHPPMAARRGHRRPVHAAREDRRRRHGRGLGRQADRAGQAQGGAQAHQGGHGLEGRAAALRAGAAGPGHDGPPQHRPRARRRHDARPAGRSSSWSWSTACR